MNFEDMPQSKEDTVRIRPIEVGDLDALFEMHVDPESNAMDVTIPRTQEAFYEHWHRSLQQDNITPRAILLDETFVGCISCFLIDGKMSLGYWIDRKHWGKGIATAAVALMLEAIQKNKEIVRIEAKIFGGNGASARVLEKNNFVLEGTRKNAIYKNGVIADEQVWVYLVA
jgi:RimJ/RimL family protein N-acetyltransferase